MVIGLGTSAPEFVVSGSAAARGSIGLAVGNIVGSNILNLTLILGLAALAGTIAVTSTVIRREVPLAAGAVVVFALLAWAGLTTVTAILLAAGMAGALVLLMRWARASRSQELVGDVTELTDSGAVVDVPVPASRLPRWFEPVRALLGLAGVLAGAQLLVINASAIASDLGVSDLVIGFTLVAVGTSLPELVTAVQAQRRGQPDLVVGNLFGSNLFNSLAGGAVVGFAAGNQPARAGMTLLLAMILTSGLAWALLRRGLRLSRVEGVVLLAIYALIVPMLLAA